MTARTCFVEEHGNPSSRKWPDRLQFTSHRHEPAQQKYLVISTTASIVVKDSSPVCLGNLKRNRTREILNSNRSTAAISRKTIALGSTVSKHSEIPRQYSSLISATGRQELPSHRNTLSQRLNIQADRLDSISMTITQPGVLGIPRLRRQLIDSTALALRVFVAWEFQS